jgi:uncharacterized protein YfaS (alpha-2-macroglobulin family)
MKEILFRQRLVILFVIFASVATAIIYFSNRTNAVQSFLQPDAAFGQYISAYTTRYIPSDAPIRIELAAPLTDSLDFSKPIQHDLFDISPKVSGKAYWINPQTIEFRPDDKWENGKNYKITFKLHQVVEVTDSKLKNFAFNVQIIPQYAALEEEGLAFENNQADKPIFLGTITTSDVADEQQIEQSLLAEQEGNDLQITWKHSRTKHDFVIKNIRRKEKTSLIKITFNGKKIGAEYESETEINIPPTGFFDVFSHKIIQFPEQYVSIRFSEPLDNSQNLQGLVGIQESGTINYQIHGNEIRLYPAVSQTGEKEMFLYAGIKSNTGKKLNSNFIKNIDFLPTQPAIRFVGEGVIVPTHEKGAIIPFEAIGLKAVQIKVIKVFANNMTQFLQTNSLNGSGQLSRVGKPILTKTIPLMTHAQEATHWKKYHLDLNELIKTEVGAVYRVVLSFKKEHTNYPCSNVQEKENLMTYLSETTNENEENKWNGSDEYYYYEDSEDEYYYYEDDYWEHRNNPCHDAFYAYNRSSQTIGKNILLSDIGLIAKRGESGDMQVIVTDLRSTNELSGIELEVYDFQQQLIEKIVTDRDGIARLTNKQQTPFLVVAYRGEQRGYLKVNDNSALSVSNFDVSGEATEGGIKGFIYGERGVWRPGDSVYVSFMLEDKVQKLPQGHPIIFEWRNPQGKLMNRQTRTVNNKGLYTFATHTQQNDLTGAWNATIKIGNINFSKILRVETIKPNRLKIHCNLADKKYLTGSSENAQLQVRWLTGANAAHLKANFEMQIQQGKTVFEGFTNYVFDDVTQNFYQTEANEIFNGQLDAAGNANFKVNFNLGEQKAPGALRVIISGKVFEPSGDFSIERFTIPYYPYTHYAGFKIPTSKNWYLNTNEKHTFSLASVNVEGKPEDKRLLQVKLYKLEWRWWWEETHNNNRYVSTWNSQLIETKELMTQNGKVNYSTVVEDKNWGRYLLVVTDKKSGHSASEVLYFDNYYGISQRKMPESATTITFTSDKNEYEIGEKAQISIPSYFKGKALISIESGAKVLKTEWLQVKDDINKYELTITPNMTPNVYVHVTLLQPHAQTENELPIRQYGILPIQVKNKATILQPTLQAPEQFYPEKNATITVSESNGKPMYYTLAVVDEGLLDLTHFKTPNPHTHFYKREALGVKTFDIYDQVVGAFAQKMDNIIAIGGDMEIKPRTEKEVVRFKPVVRFYGPFSLEKGEKKTHTFKMPNYIGSVRTMVVATDGKGAYGNAEIATPVKQSLMLLATLPRVISPAEEIKVPVNIFVTDKNIKNVSVQIKVNDLLVPQGNVNQHITFNAVGDRLVFFNLKAKEMLGAAQVKITATANGITATETIDLQVRSANPVMTEVMEKMLETNEIWTTDFTNIGINGTNKALLELAIIPPINLSNRLEYLLQYPHGCAEQTISAAFPQLFVKNITEITAEQQQKIEGNIQAALQKLNTLQLADGSFAYWQGMSQAHDWTTSYAGHFLIEARKKGYPVDNLLEKWFNYQKNVANQWQPNQNDVVQSYRLYALALANKAEIGAMNRLKESNNRSLLASWQLAATYHLIGQPHISEQILKEINTDIGTSEEPDYLTFGSKERNKALIITSLVTMGKTEQAAPLMRELSISLSSEKWLSTQSTAFALIAAAQFAEKQRYSNEIKADVKHNQTQFVAQTQLPLVLRPLEVSKNQTHSLSIKNNGKSTLYARLLLVGAPIAGKETEQANNLQMTINYKDKKGNKIDVSQLTQGTDFIAEVSVKHTGMRNDYKDLALTQIFPSGWEIQNTRLQGEIENTTLYDYQDIRDDRILTYFSLKMGQVKTFQVQLTATYPGKFYLPATYCEAMYDNSVQANNVGKWIVVKEANIYQ